jgi:hypothetical protein
MLQPLRFCFNRNFIAAYLLFVVLAFIAGAQAEAGVVYSVTEGQYINELPANQYLYRSTYNSNPINIPIVTLSFTTNGTPVYTPTGYWGQSVSGPGCNYIDLKPVEYNKLYRVKVWKNDDCSGFYTTGSSNKACAQRSVHFEHKLIPINITGTSPYEMTTGILTCTIKQEHYYVTSNTSCNTFDDYEVMCKMPLQ